MTDHADDIDILQRLLADKADSLERLADRLRSDLDEAGDDPEKLRDVARDLAGRLTASRGTALHVRDHAEMHALDEEADEPDGEPDDPDY